MAFGRKSSTTENLEHASTDFAVVLLDFEGLVTAWRDGAAMPYLLAVHLGIVLALFVSLAYGKFVHGIYRFLALVRYAKEKRMLEAGA